MSELLMPRLSDSMEQGTIVRWLKTDGEHVQRGEEIVEIETDKATMAYEADASGALAIQAEEGASVAVGAAIATIGGAPGDLPARSGERAGEAVAAEVAAGASGHARIGPRESGRRPVDASPVAIRTARRLAVDLAALVGTGPRGRILKADVMAAARTDPASISAAPAAESHTSASNRGAVTVAQLTRLQQTVARRMAESKATAPDFVVQVDADLTELTRLRMQLKELPGRAPSMNDFLLKAAAITLRRHARVNGAYRDGAVELYDRVNVGMAVATEDGLLVPTIFDADTLSVGAISAAAGRLAERARTGELTPPELGGGTFTVSNLGMFGVDRFVGIINPPQAAILCAGAVTRRPVVREDGNVEARELMTLSLTCDHRVLYGAHAASFLADLRGTLEAPLNVLL